uniref:Uncharacterized protein n=1 Tax=Anopheles dirus TaxID=7168 RepID=A0A182NWF6_9DIPT
MGANQCMTRAEPNSDRQPTYP